MFKLRLKSLWRRFMHRTSLDQSLDAEVRAYLEHDIDNRIAEGMSPPDARRAALVELGGMDQVKESTRDARTAAWLDGVLADIRYAFRTLRRRPSLAVLAILTMGLGIGASTSIFTIVDTVLLKPLPFREADRLVSIKVTLPGMRTIADPLVARIWNENDLTFQQYQALVKRKGVFDETAVLNRGSAILQGRGDPERIPFARVSASLFPMLGLRPANGRLFSTDDEAADAVAAAILSHELWMRVFGGDPSVVGSKVLLDTGGGAVARVVAGILPPHFDFAAHGFDGSPSPQVWIPLRISANANPDDLVNFETFALLKRGIAISAAESLVAQIANEVPMLPNEPFGKAGGRVVKRQEFETRDTRSSLLLLLIASGFLLVIAGGNVGNLLLGQAAVRGQEIATRAALGAKRSRIMRQLITESLLLALAGGATGALLAPLGVRALLALAPSDLLPRMAEIGVDLRVLAFVLATSVTVGTCLGIAPALILLRPNLNLSLKENARSQSGSHGRLQGGIVAAEIALSFVLLIGAGLLVQSFQRLNAVNLGFQSKNLLAASIRLSGRRYDKPGAREAFYTDVLPRIKALPGVVDASVVDRLPFKSSSATSAEIEGSPLPKEHLKPLVQYRAILPNYFAVLRAPLTAGRMFTEAEAAGNAPVMIINSAMAGKFWSGSPLFKRVKLDGRWYTIVGVVTDLKELALAEEVSPTSYIPQPRSEANVNIVLRAAGQPLSLAQPLREEVRRFDPGLPIENLDTLDNLIALTAAEARYRTILISSFAVCATFLALIGLYGVISCIVAYRRREMGIRIALGAPGADIIILVFKKSLLFTLAGIAIGVPVALGATRMLTSFLFEIAVTDSLTYLIIAAVVLMASFFASLTPALRAARIDPIRSLRVE